MRLVFMFLLISQNRLWDMQTQQLMKSSISERPAITRSKDVGISSIYLLLKASLDTVVVQPTERFLVVMATTSL